MEEDIGCFEFPGSVSSFLLTQWLTGNISCLEQKQNFLSCLSLVYSDLSGLGSGVEGVGWANSKPCGIFCFVLKKVKLELEGVVIYASEVFSWISRQSKSRHCMY